MTARAFVVLAVGLLATATLVAQDANKQELDKLQGKWEMMLDGKTTTYSVKGDAYYFVGPMGRDVMVKFRIDASQQQKHFDKLPGNGPAILGIYELKGDTLTICTGTTDRRPTEFTDSKTSGGKLSVWKRVAKVGS